jgi:phospholipase C
VSRGRCIRAFVCLLASSSLLFLAGCGGNANPQTPPPEQPKAAAPAIQFTADKTTITAGQTVVLTWTATNASSVSIQPGQTNLGTSGTLSVTPASNTPYTATATGPGGTASATVTITVTAPAPPTITLTATPATVTAGQFSTLQWTTTAADSVALSPPIPAEDNQPLALNGSAPVVPTSTTTYTATATGPGGTATATVTVNVTQPPPTLSLSVNPTSIIAGQSATLAWTSSNAKTITIDNGIGSVAVPSGNTTVTPTQTTTYTATATGPGGSVTASATLTVQQQLAVTLTANPTTIGAGQNSTLTWTSQAATSVTISPEPGAVDLSGSVSLKPAQTTTYTATATDAAGDSKTAQVTVTVLPPGGLKDSIKHIIFFVQENRSFDNYFGMLGQYRVSKGLSNDIDGLPLDASQKDHDGVMAHPYHQQTTCAENTSPSWNPSWGAYDNGQMDQFVWVHDQPSTIDPQYHRAMAYYDQSDLPYYYELASQFATSDRWFEPVMAGTIPNRMYLFAGTSFGHIFPDPPPTGGWQQKTIFDLLNQYHVTWRYYYQDNSIFLGQWRSWNDPAIQQNVVNISEWYKILADPQADALLPQVVFIERASEWQNPQTGELCTASVSASCTSLDEHPDANAQVGAARAEQIINALLGSAAWKSSVFILTYDEFGGLYDHVPIIAAPAPDDIPPIASPGFETPLPGDFAHTGFRIPLIVISPWVKPHYVSHTSTDSTAILKLIETRFGLPALTPRDAWASDMTEYFDFSSPALLNAPNGKSWPSVLPTQPTSEPCDYNLEIKGQE